ncbi:hypothetical protein [Actinokineospora sp. NBRC 105648]|uniref:hypothetical protein n=1 Tax=Actinokineospora sp. NBRC 105648 TaxID=3032206 RepID=UPI0024A1D125|nr:hypothetical protein [Actinokineospora sp. NBRC 105648]GLZ36385.1 hypothetical protein Acsp05_00100 [Actinokineospora sp. NBRC 105648]
MSQPCEQSQPSELSEVDDLLRAVVADGFTVYLCGGADRPEAIVATYAWEDHVDYVVIKDAHDVTAARSRQSRDWDVFAPASVVWSYQGHARWALRAILDLLPPEHPDAPAEDYPAPTALRVDPAHLANVSVRSPRPGLVARRAMRLRLAVG